MQLHLLNSPVLLVGARVVAEERGKVEGDVVLEARMETKISLVEVMPIKVKCLLLGVAGEKVLILNESCIGGDFKFNVTILHNRSYDLRGREPRKRKSNWLLWGTAPKKGWFGATWSSSNTSFSDALHLR